MTAGSWWFLALVVLLLMSAELFTRDIVLARSRILSRTVREREQASSLTARNVLVVGNSLLKAGVDPDSFRQQMAPEWDGRRFVIESTNFADWYYGLKNLFEKGSRPASVAVMLDARQFVTWRVLGEPFGYFLMGLGDTAGVARETGLSPTETSNLLAGHLSAFYGVRADIRKVLLAKFFPGMETLAPYLTPPPPPPLTFEQVYQGSRAYLSRYRELADRHHVRVLVVVPPMLVPAAAYVEHLQRAGREVGVPVLVPLPSAELDASYFESDRYHLNPKGGAVFAPRFSAAWKSWLAAAAASQPNAGL